MTIPKTPKTPTVVVFGKAGAGKTTVAEKGIDLIRDNSDQLDILIDPLGIDLDVCIPQWMKDNFGKGIYPTLKERQDFAVICCDHVDKCIQDYYNNNNNDVNDTSVLDIRKVMAVVVSFSFVNKDLRDIFRSRFPQAKWLLVNTTDDEAQRRIDAREGHFYKGKITKNDGENPTKSKSSTKDEDNSEWDFAPVDFPHILLNGQESVEKNAKIVAKVLVEEAMGATAMT